MTSYSARQLCSDIGIGILLTTLVGIAINTGLPKATILGSLKMVFIVFGLLGALFTLLRACYDGTTLLYHRAPSNWQGIVQLAVVSLAWLLVLTIFAQHAALGRAISSFAGWPFTVSAAIFLGWVARVVTASVQPRPRMRGYLVTLGLIVLLLGPSRYGYSLGSPDDEDGWNEPMVKIPQERRDTSFLLYLVYSATCFVGIASVRSAHASVT